MAARRRLTLLLLWALAFLGALEAPAPSSADEPSAHGIVFKRWLMDGSGEQIVVVDPDTSVETVIMSAPNPYPAWSPDGKKVAFGAGGISVLNLETTETVKISDHGYMAAWSPDGTRIAFTSEGTGGLDIWVMNADGSDQRRLTDAPGYDDNATWSPDGTRIAFISTRDDDGQGNIELEIYMMNADGSGQTRLTLTGYNNEPDWSPDGSTIAFASDRDGYTQIYFMSADGSDQRALVGDHWCTHPATPDPTPRATRTVCGGDHDPTWSPDGMRLAFTSFRNDWSELYVIDADGSSERRLTSNDYHDMYPDWGLPPTSIARAPASEPPADTLSPSTTSSPTPCTTTDPATATPTASPSQPMSRSPSPPPSYSSPAFTPVPPDPTLADASPAAPTAPTPSPPDSPTPTCPPEENAGEEDDSGISPEATLAAAAALGALVVGPPLLAAGALALRARRRPTAGQ